MKNHYDPTAGLAYMVRKQVAGVEVFGGVDLNLPVGGMNPAAVEHMTQVSGGYGRVVWMSTFDAENQVSTRRRAGRSSACRGTASCSGDQRGHRRDREAQSRARNRPCLRG